MSRKAIGNHCQEYHKKIIKNLGYKDFFYENNYFLLIQLPNEWSSQDLK